MNTMVIGFGGPKLIENVKCFVYPHGQGLLSLGADDDFIRLFRFSINYLRRVKSVHQILIVHRPAS